MNIKLSDYQSALIRDIESRKTFSEWICKAAEQFDIWTDYVSDPNVDPEYHVIGLTWTEGDNVHSLRSGKERLFDDEENYEMRPGQLETMKGIVDGTLDAGEVFVDFLNELIAGPEIDESTDTTRNY